MFLQKILDKFYKNFEIRNYYVTISVILKELTTVVKINPIFEQYLTSTSIFFVFLHIFDN